MADVGRGASSEWATLVPAGDGATFIHTAVFDEAMRALKPTTFLLLSMIIGKVRDDPRHEVRASLRDLGTHDGMQVLALNSVVTSMRELAALGIVEASDTLEGPTATRTYRLRDVDEWDHDAIGSLLAEGERFQDERSAVRNHAQWPALRRQVFERDDFTCRYCGQQGGVLHVDHVLPVARGGTNDLGNLVAACKRCNRSKSGKTLDEWQPC